MRVVDSAVRPGVEADMGDGDEWPQAMQGRDFNDLDQVPEAIANTTASAARNAVHVAILLRRHDYPPYK